MPFREELSGKGFPKKRFEENRSIHRRVGRHTSHCIPLLFYILDLSKRTLTTLAAMASLEAKEFLRELETCSYSQFDLVSSLKDLAFSCKSLKSDYLDLQEVELRPLLLEYFGVALAFAALGALLRDANGNQVKEDENDNNSNFQGTILRTMLKWAIERLQCLARNAQDLQEIRLTESTERNEVDRKDWDQEKDIFLQKLANAEEEVEELKIRRGEDAKANERVVRIYASREQGWKFEKKNLLHEIDMLRKDLINQEVSGLCSPIASPRKGHCDGCDVKKRRLKDLEKKLKEKFFMVMKDAQIKENEVHDLTSNLAEAKLTANGLNEKLNNEFPNSTDRETVLDEVRDRQKETKCRLAKAVEELETTKVHLQALNLATKSHSALTQNIISELTTLRQELEYKDVMISTVLERSAAEREEKENLAGAQVGKEIAEAETGRCRRLAKEMTWRKMSVEVPDAGRSGHRSHRSLGIRSEVENVADLQRSHTEQVNNFRAAYTRVGEALEKQLSIYRMKAPSTDSSPNPTLMSEDLQGPLSDPAFKAWFEVVKGRLGIQLEEKHWNQIETFERHLRVKDERLSDFRSKLITLESKLAESKEEVEDLECNSLTAVEDCSPRAKIGQVSEIFSKVPKMAHQQSLEKLRMELQNVRDKLKERDAEHMATIEKMAENVEAELRHKDAQLAVLEAKLCQVQLQLKEAKLANAMASSDNCEEKMFLENIDKTQAPKPKEASHCIRPDVADSGVKVLESRVIITESRGQKMRCEEPAHQDCASDSALLLSTLKGMCLKEERSPAMMRFHRELELDASDSLIFSTDDCWLIGEPKLSAMPLQSLPAQDSHLPVKVSHIAREDEKVAFADKPLNPQCPRDINTLLIHKEKLGVNKQPLSPDPTVGQIFADILLPQAPSKGRKGTRPARFDMFNVLEDQNSQRTLFTEIDGLQAPITNPTFIAQVSKDKLALHEERNTSRTREDIQVLGLALEVSRIEQQLSQMNNSNGDAHTPITRPERSAKSPVAAQQTANEKTGRYCGLAGKVSRLVKQIGFTKPLPRAAAKSQKEVKNEVKKEYAAVFQSDLFLRKNPLFSQKSSASELASLHRRAEKVGKNLAAIQTRLERENSPDIYRRYKPLFFECKLVDTVRTHLSQVQGALHSELTKTTSAARPLRLPVLVNQCAAPKPLSPRKYSSPTTPAPCKQFSPTKPSTTPSPRRITSSTMLTPSPKRMTSSNSLTPPKLITSSKPLTPSPRSLTPCKPLTQALSPCERRTLVQPKTTMRVLIKEDPRTRATFGRRETKPVMYDLQTQQWTRKTSTQESLRMDVKHQR